MDILNSFMNDTQSIIQSPASGLYSIIRLQFKSYRTREKDFPFFKLDFLEFNKNT